MIFFKIILLQLFWLMIVLYGKSLNPFIQILTAVIFVGLDWLISKPNVSSGRYLFLIGLFILVGFLNDSSLIWFKLIYKDSYQYGNLSLWIIFLIYYEEIFVKLKKLSLVSLALIGGVAGALTYWSSVKLGAIVIYPKMENEFLLSQFIFWAAFFPLSLKLYFNKRYWGSFLDKTILFSFDKSGFLRHQNEFNENLRSKSIRGQVILVTGSTAGIGAEVAAFLSSLGGKTYITGRNRQKGLSFEKQYQNSEFISLDMANWKEVYEFAKTCQPLDHVIFNAGSMPEKLQLNENGIEFQCASQLLGHYYLLAWLRKFGKLKSGARIVWVTSGGMYLKKLDLSSLFKQSNYDKVETYANVKRAQVTLVEELSKQAEWSDFSIYSMHPGWVGTDGLKEALPKFYQLMKNRLRSPQEGADTILWLILTDEKLITGGLYFDRKKVSPYIAKKYIPTEIERADFISLLEEYRNTAEKMF